MNRCCLLVPIVCALLPLAPKSVADYTAVSSLVKSSSATSPTSRIAGEGITAGQAVYKSGSTVYLTTSTNSTKADLEGIAVNSAAQGQPVLIVSADPGFMPGITNMVAGEVLILSATPGGIANVTNLSSGWYPTIIGVALSATNMNFQELRGTAPVP